MVLLTIMFKSHILWDQYMEGPDDDPDIVTVDKDLMMIPTLLLWTTNKFFAQG